MPRKNANARKRDKLVPVEELVAPTPEQMARGFFRKVLQADHKTSPHKRDVMIDRLHDDGKLSERQWKGLSKYRDIVNQDERSPIADSVARLGETRGGNGDRMPIETYASIERGWLERELGSLVDIAYAIAFEDKSLSQWAMQVSGAVERRRANPGRKDVVWFEPRRAALKIALVDIRFAGDRLAAAIKA